MGALALEDAVVEIRPVEAVGEDLRTRQQEPLDDLAPRRRVGGGGQRQARHAGVALAQEAELEVLGAEVVPPLGHAMRLVDREQGETRAVEELEEAGRHQPLRRDVEQIELAGPEGTLDARRFAPGGRFECSAAARDAELGERRHLVVHQRDERRDDDAGPLAQQRRELVADRLAAAGRHQHQGVLAALERRDDLALPAAEGSVAEDTQQQLLGPVAHRRVLYHAAPSVGSMKVETAIAALSRRIDSRRCRKSIFSTPAPPERAARTPGRCSRNTGRRSPRSARRGSSRSTRRKSRALLASVDEVILARGKKTERRPAKEVAPDDLRGPTGNFRAPLVRRGRTLLVGYNPEALAGLL